ncbi:TetR/AcrR family transcriptional regulator [Lysinibacillus sp. NPDC048646]|uniref:TetR/AcrR family transcriptional regulator n=1 Tax=Lysinibacillus sp. NPDC048646 TaxID=3390574 RepID=UPI003D06E6F0
MSNPIFDAILAQGLTKWKTEKQRSVVETSIKMFAEKGYANTSTAEIARAAGVSEGTIFKHFGTKDHLLLSIIVPFVNDFFPVMVKEVLNDTLSENTKTFEQFLRDLLKNRIAFVTENKEIFQVFIKEVIYREELKRELVPYFKKLVPPLFTNIVEQFKESGELIDLPADRILKTLLTLLGGFFVSRFLLMENYIISEDEIEDVVQFVMNGLRKNQTAE